MQDIKRKTINICIMNLLDFYRRHYGSHKAEIDGVMAQIWEKKGLSCRLVEELARLEKQRRDFR